MECRSKYIHIQPNINKGTWTKLEDVIVGIGHAIYGAKFSEIAKIFERESLKHHTQVGLPNSKVITHLRTEIQIRERWTYILSGEVKTGKFTPEEDQ